MKLSDLGLNSQAINFLRYFESMTGLAEDFDFWHVSTTPYFNGRERGFVLSVDLGVSKGSRRWAFYEARSSDSLKAVAWEDDRFIAQQPLTNEDVPDEAWNQYLEAPESFPHGDFGKAGRYLEDELRAALERRKENEETRVAAQGAEA
jgi:hypothetical protein